MRMLYDLEYVDIHGYLLFFHNLHFSLFIHIDFSGNFHRLQTDLMTSWS